MYDSLRIDGVFYTVFVRLGIVGFCTDVEVYEAMCILYARGKWIPKHCLTGEIAV